MERFLLAQNEIAKSLPKVSVCISTYFPGQVLRQVLEAIQGLEYPVELIEILVMVSPRDSESRQIVEEFNLIQSARFKLFENDSRTVSATRNFGIRNCASEVVLAIDDDIVVNKDILMEGVKVLSEDKRVGAVVFGVLMETPTLDERLYHMKFLGSGLSSTYAVTPCSVFRRSALNASGYYREDMGPPLSIYEDWEFGSRIAKKGFKVLVDGKLFAKHLRNEAFRHSSKAAASNEGSKAGFLKLALQYVRGTGKNYWAFFQVMRSSPTRQRLEYALYLISPYVLFGLFAVGIVYSFFYFIGLACLVVMNSLFIRRQYRKLNFRQRITYPWIMFLIRVIRTNLATWFFLQDKVHKKGPQELSTRSVIAGSGNREAG